MLVTLLKARSDHKMQIWDKFYDFWLNFTLIIFQLNFTGALLSYERALHVSAQREVRLLCLHEVFKIHF